MYKKILCEILACVVLVIKSLFKFSVLSRECGKQKVARGVTSGCRITDFRAERCEKIESERITNARIVVSIVQKLHLRLLSQVRFQRNLQKFKQTLKERTLIFQIACIQKFLSEKFFEFVDARRCVSFVEITEIDEDFTRFYLFDF